MGFLARLTEVDWGDAPAWAAVGIAILALIIAALSAGLSWKSLRWEQQGADAALRSAEAAERANRLTEQRTGGRKPDGKSGRWPVQRTISRPFRHSVGGSSRYTQRKTQEAPNVTFEIERRSGNRYVLRNTGTATADHVQVDATQAGPTARNLPRDSVIRPGEGTDILLAGTWGHPTPNQLYVRWAGQPEWVAVPMPN